MIQADHVLHVHTLLHQLHYVNYVHVHVYTLKYSFMDHDPIICMCTSVVKINNMSFDIITIHTHCTMYTHVHMYMLKYNVRVHVHYLPCTDLR